MPLRDHFHPPWSNEEYWEGFHFAWINTLVRHLNGTLLPSQYRAVPRIHFGTWVAADVATLERRAQHEGPETDPDNSAAGVATAVWAPPQPAHVLEVTFPDQDLFEVRVLDETRGQRLVGAVEMISPRNKDRPESRQAFVAKCAAYLRQRVGLVIVDVVTARRANLHQQLLRLLSPNPMPAGFSGLWASAYRTREENPDEGKTHLELWPVPLAVGGPLPTVRLWLNEGPTIPIDLEATYEETCRVLRIR